MVLKIRKTVLDQIVAHTQETYPEEGCGLLVASLEKRVEVVGAVRMRNAYAGPKHNRYSIDPMELYREDKSISEKGHAVVGIYHSHPEHPARPSRFDLEHAWPGVSYLILSVSKRKPVEAKSWVLDDDRTSFDEEAIEFI